MNRFIIISIITHIFVIGIFFIIKPSTNKIVSFSSPKVIDVKFIKFKEPIPEVENVVEDKPIVKKKVVQKKVVKKQKPVLAEKKVPEKINKKKVDKVKKLPIIDSVKTKVVKEKKEPPVKSGASIEQKSFVYDYYLKMLQSKIYINFNPPYNLKLEEKVVTIYFDIDKRGNVSNIKFEKETQSGLLNRLAMRAVKELKMPPLPKKFVDGGDEILSIHFTFIYKNKE